MALQLNQRALTIARRLIAEADALRVAVIERPGLGPLVDLGINAAGGFEAGRRLAEVCLAGLGRVSFVPALPDVWDGPAVMVVTDHPVAACMAAQYAGWRIASGEYFAMGSGPMRAAAGKEELFERIGYRESTSDAVGVLETRQIPPEDVCTELARECGVEPARLALLVAPTASQAGNVQVVARSVETAMHKLYELGFDLARVKSGFGVAPLPPVATSDLAGIGRTNDAILYGARVTLWVRGDDDSLDQIGPQTPSNASADHGRPFAEIFRRYDHDFYQIDRRLFSPAEITFHNLDTGRTFRFGAVLPDVLRESFTKE